MTKPQSSPPSGPRYRPQFGLGTLMLTMLMLSVLSAAVGSLLGGTTEARLKGVVLIVAGPMGVMIAYSLFRQFQQWRRRSR